MTPDDRDLFQLPTGFIKARIGRFLLLSMGFVAWMLMLAGGIYFGYAFDEFPIAVRLGGVVIGFLVGAGLFFLVRWQLDRRDRVRNRVMERLHKD